MTDTSKPLTPKPFGSDAWRREIATMHTSVDREVWRQSIVQRLKNLTERSEDAR